MSCRRSSPPAASASSTRSPGPHGIDGYLEQIDPLLVTGERRAEVTAVERGTAESVTLTLRPNRAWEGFRAGQFVQLAVEIDGVRHQRCYSPASAEGRRAELEITVKRHPGGPRLQLPRRPRRSRAWSSASPGPKATSSCRARGRARSC